MELIKRSQGGLDSASFKTIFHLQNATKEQSDTTVSNDLPSTCPNNAMNKHSIKEFARIIRKEYRRPQQQQQPDRLQCNSDNIEQKFKDAYLNADPNRLVFHYS